MGFDRREPVSEADTDFSNGARRMMYFFSSPVRIRQEIMDRIYVKCFGMGVQEFNSHGKEITTTQQHRVAKLLTNELMQMDMPD
jgi:hypothetical protein